MSIGEIFFIKKTGADVCPHLLALPYKEDSVQRNMFPSAFMNLFGCYTKEAAYAEYDAYYAVDIHKASEKSEKPSDNGNSSKYGNQEP